MKYDRVVQFSVGVLAILSLGTMVTCTDRPSPEDERQAFCDEYCEREEECFPAIDPDDPTNSRDEAMCRAVCSTSDDWDGCRDELVANIDCMLEFTCEQWQEHKRDTSESPCAPAIYARLDCRARKAAAR